MYDGPDFPTTTVPAQRFAKAFLNVWPATGDEPDSYHLYRTFTLERFEDTDDTAPGLRIICSNGSGLVLTAWVPAYHTVDEDGPVYEEPAPSVAPAQILTVSDPGRRLVQLMKHLSKPEKEGVDDGRGEALDVGVGVIERTDGQLTIGNLGDSWGLLVTAPREKVCVPILQGATPTDWRFHYRDGFDFSAFKPTGLSSKNVAAVASVPAELGVAAWYRSPDETDEIIRVEVRTDVGVVHGLLGPRVTVGPVADDDEPSALRTGTGLLVSEKFSQDDADALAAADADPDDDPDAGEPIEMDFPGRNVDGSYDEAAGSWFDELDKPDDDEPDDDEPEPEPEPEPEKPASNVRPLRRKK